MLVKGNPALTSAHSHLNAKGTLALIHIKWGHDFWQQQLLFMICPEAQITGLRKSYGAFILKWCYLDSDSFQEWIKITVLPQILSTCCRDLFCIEIQYLKENVHIAISFLTHWGLDKMADFFSTTFYEFCLRFVPKFRINNIPALVQIMAWRQRGDKPLFEPIMVSLLTHICITRP